MDETRDQWKEIFIQDGVLLKLAPESHVNDINASGSLSIVEYSDGRLTVEWRPNDLIMIEADAQDADWAVVDTIGGRNRTISGGTVSSDHFNSRIIQYYFDDIDSFKLTSKNRQITLIKKMDRESCTFYFPHGNADYFTQHLKARCKTYKLRHDTYVIVQPTAEMHSLNKSFAELDLFQDHPSDMAWSSIGSIVSNFKQRPIMTTLEGFAKLSDLGTAKIRRHATVGASVVLNNISSVYYSHEDSSSNPLSISSTEEKSSDEAPPAPSAETTEEYEHVNKYPPLPPRPNMPRGAPLNASQWESLREDSEGRIKEVEAVKHIIFRGGAHPNLRYEVWKYLLNYYPWNMTNVERIVHQKQKVQEYYTMKQQWKTMTPGQESRFADYHERKSLVEKDVNRTDRTCPYYAGDNNPNLTTLFDILMTYVMYNFDLGYVQGMSDLLSPILCLCDNEADAFWCFVGFMDKVQSNFDIDQAGMKYQLQSLHQLLSFTHPDLANYLTKHDSGNMYFCFRWLLVLFKREFSQPDIMRLWEVLWTGLPCANFHLLISIAILDTEKDILMGREYGFTEILKHINDLSMRIELDYILSKAEGIYQQVVNSSHLTDQIRIILGLEPLCAIRKDDSDSETEDNEAVTTPVRNGNGKLENDNKSMMNGSVSLRTDTDEASYQRSLDMNYL